jgi:hypothetical protein
VLMGRFSHVVRVVSLTVVLIGGRLESMGFASGFLFAATVDGIVFVAFSCSVDMLNTLTNCQIMRRSIKLLWSYCVHSVHYV